jgi:hypothetical protein
MQLLTGLLQTLGQLTVPREKPLAEEGMLGRLRLLAEAWLGDGIPIRRKRLFALACCRKVWPWLDEPPCQHVVRNSELFADGLVNREQLETAVVGRFLALPDADREAHDQMRRCVTMTLIEGNVLGLLPLAATLSGTNFEAVSAIYHDLFANAFQPVTVEPAWREWNGGALVRMAQVMYDQRAFADLPILADALEEADCDNPELLTHLRSAGPHYIGCWALDMLLGRP